MALLARSSLRVALLGFSLSAPVLAQEGPPPTATFPTASPEPVPAPAAPPVTQPQPAPAPPPPPPTAAPPAGAPTPAPEPPTYYQQPIYEPPPPPPAPPEDGTKIPSFSVRVDPFNLLLEGKLGFELEVELLKWMTVELVPVFVVNEAPPTFGYVSGFDEELRQESDGLGALAGSSLDVGFWLQGKAFEGYVLRAMITNYAYNYVSSDSEGQIDQVSHVERQFFGFFGSHSRWGAFTMAGGIGLGAELNNEKRCFDAEGKATSQCSKSRQLIQVSRPPAGETIPFNTVDLKRGLGGVQLLVRFSLGVVF
jgi:hypothetical protein